MTMALSFQNLFLVLLLGLSVGVNAEQDGISCDDPKQLNPHCRAVCRFKQEKKLRADGTFNKGQIIREIISSEGLENGAEIAADALECAERYGPYKETENCHGIEKFMACIDDMNLKQCNAKGDRTSEKCNTYDGGLECQGRVHHWPTLYLEAFDECTGKTNSSYMRLRCLWKNVGDLNDDYSARRETIQHWGKIMFGRKLAHARHKACVESTQHIDFPKTFGVATEENAIDILSDFMATKRDAFYKMCGPLSLDRFTTKLL